MSDPVTDARAAVAKVHQIIEHDAANAPRTLQKRIGPSELGVACDRCLVHMLAGTPKAEQGVPWLPWIGTAVHAAVEDAIVRSMLADLKAGVRDMDEWIVEGDVVVGDIDGQPISGHADLFHVPSGTVIDHKCTGSTTLKKVGRNGEGTSLTYRRQAHLYGRGFALLGHTVRAVAINYLPRNAMSLASARVFAEPYDEAIALEALERATRFAQWIRLFGADAVLAGCAPHSGAEFSCAKYADASSTQSAPNPAEFLGVA